jgi:hypothetical protein
MLSSRIQECGCVVCAIDGRLVIRQNAEIDSGTVRDHEMKVAVDGTVQEQHSRSSLVQGSGLINCLWFDLCSAVLYCDNPQIFPTTIYTVPLR